MSNSQHGGASNKITRHYKLNVGFSPLNEYGDIDHTAHAKRVKPLVDQIKQLDGVENAYVEQWHIRVAYWDHVVTPALVDKYVIGYAFPLVLDRVHSICPQRGDKTPTVSLDEDKPFKSPYEWLVCELNSNLVAYKAETGNPANYLMLTTKDLANSLSDTDGVIDRKLDFQFVALRYDTRCTTRIEVEAHMRAKLEAAASHNASSKILPYLVGRPDKELKLSFSTRVEL
jgi:hypothetical protein